MKNIETIQILINKKAKAINNVHVPYRQLVGKSDKAIESFVKEIADKLNS